MTRSAWQLEAIEGIYKRLIDNGLPVRDFLTAIYKVEAAMENFSFTDLVQGHPSPERTMLVQAIAMISTLEGFTHMTPEDVFDYIKRDAERVARMEEL